MDSPVPERTLMRVDHGTHSVHVVQCGCGRMHKLTCVCGEPIELLVGDPQPEQGYGKVFFAAGQVEYEPIDEMTMGCRLTWPLNHAGQSPLPIILHFDDYGGTLGPINVFPLKSGAVTELFAVPPVDRTVTGIETSMGLFPVADIRDAMVYGTSDQKEEPAGAGQVRMRIRRTY